MKSKIKFLLGPRISLGQQRQQQEQQGFVPLPPEVCVHRTPPGSFPKNGPKPSKLAILLFYISCVFCVLGSIMITRSFFFKEEESQERVQVLCIGSALALVGILFAFVMNVMNKRENERIIAYLYAKAEEMRDDRNSRQRFNQEYALHLGQDGPNGTH